MRRRLPRSTRTDTSFPESRLFRSSDLGAGDVELGAAVVVPAVVYADRAPIFGDADIEIFQIAAVEHDALRVDLRIADAPGDVETKVAAGHDCPSVRYGASPAARRYRSAAQ